MVCGCCMFASVCMQSRRSGHCPINISCLSLTLLLHPDERLCSCAGLATIAFVDANESMGHPYIVAMLFARCVRWTVRGVRESSAKRAHGASMCSMSVRTERCIFLVWWYSVRVYALVCQACAFACALINILPTLVECRITRKRNLKNNHFSVRPT